MPDFVKPITLKKDLVVSGKKFVAGTAIGEVKVVEGIPVDRALNALRIGVAVLDEQPKPEPEKKPAK